MNPKDSARIQSTQAKGGKDIGSGGFAARAQAASAHNVNAAAQGSSQASHGSSPKGGQTQKSAK